MRVMVIVKADKNSEAGIQPTKETRESFAAMGRFNEELVRADVMLAGEGLQPSSKGKRVKFSGQERTVTDGPFTEAKELIAGFWLWQVKSMEEAVEWLKRAPFDGTEVEIRQVFEVQDFPAEVVTPEHAARMQALRDELESEIQGLRTGLDSVAAEVHDIELPPAVHVLPGTPRSGLNMGKRTQALRMHRMGEASTQIAAALEVPEK